VHKAPRAVTRCNLLQSLLSTLTCRKEAAELILNGKRGLSERRGTHAQSVHGVFTLSFPFSYGVHYFLKPEDGHVKHDLNERCCTTMIRAGRIALLVDIFLRFS
jgi:hypothetical protein